MLTAVDRNRLNARAIVRAEKRYRTSFEGQRLGLLGARFQFLAIGAPGRDAAKPYPLVDEIIKGDVPLFVPLFTFM